MPTFLEPTRTLLAIYLVSYDYFFFIFLVSLEVGRSNCAFCVQGYDMTAE